MAETGAKAASVKPAPGKNGAGKKARLPLLLFVVLAILGAFALIHVIALRVGGGDIYPPYSSLRADPLGSKALYESLDALPGLSVRRLKNNNEPMPAGKAGAWLRLGVQTDAPFEMETAERDVLLAFAARGGRVIFAFAPVTSGPKWLQDCEPQDATDKPVPPPVEATPPSERGGISASAPAASPVTPIPPIPPAPAFGPASVPASAPEPAPVPSPPLIPACKPVDGDEKPAPDSAPKASSPKDSLPRSKRRREAPHRLVSFEEGQAEWGLRLHFMAQFDESVKYVPVYERTAMSARRVTADEALPPVIPDYSALWFEPRAPEWRVLYKKYNRPVLIERDWGAGKIILLADAYPFSNEAMLKDRQTPLLVSLIGPAREIIFDETQLGLHSEPGVVKLIHRYRLDGFLAGLLLLALLYLWKNARGPVPPAIFSEAEAGVVSGRGGAAALLTLLRRTLPAAKILPAALAEWQRHRAASGRAAAALDRPRLALIETTARSGGDPLANYNRIHELIHPQKRR